MANELNLSLGLSFSKNGAIIQRSLSGQFNVAGDVALQAIQTIGTVDEVLDVGLDLTAAGYLLLHNLEAYVEVTTPAAPIVTPSGTTGAATWSYKIVAKQSDGAYSAAGPAGTTTTGNATLTSGNKNVITWAAIAGADSYDIYRTAHGTSPSTNGLIGNTTALTFDDTGLAGDASTAPATGVDNTILMGENGASYPIILKGQDFALVRWSASSDIHGKANTIACKLESILISD